MRNCLRSSDALQMCLQYRLTSAECVHAATKSLPISQQVHRRHLQNPGSGVFSAKRSRKPTRILITLMYGQSSQDSPPCTDVVITSSVNLVAVIRGTLAM